jgi:hypothetical protein
MLPFPSPFNTFGEKPSQLLNINTPATHATGRQLITGGLWLPRCGFRRLKTIDALLAGANLADLKGHRFRFESKKSGA